jgi:hypothetical protein
MPSAGKPSAVKNEELKRPLAIGPSSVINFTGLQPGVKTQPKDIHLRRRGRVLTLLWMLLASGFWRLATLSL